ncbi:MAG: hypothetical protein NVS1B4_05130 [Gemmatimonadaceae bacterium]
MPVLRVVLGTNAGYVGVLGSRRRGAALLTFLRDEGITDAELARVRVPVGLDIGARDAAEIALSILAEIVAHRAQRTGATGRTVPSSDERGLRVPARHDAAEVAS